MIFASSTHTLYLRQVGVEILIKPSKTLIPNKEAQTSFLKTSSMVTTEGQLLVTLVYKNDELNPGFNINI